MKYLFILLTLMSCTFLDGGKAMHLKMAKDYCSCHGGIKSYSRSITKLDLTCNDGSGHNAVSFSLENYQFYSDCTINE